MTCSPGWVGRMRRGRPEDPRGIAGFVKFTIDRRFRFFKGDNRAVACALANFVLMRAGDRLPIFSRNRTATEADLADPGLDYPQWLAIYRLQFEDIPLPPRVKPRRPRDGWDVPTSHVLESRSTIFNRDYVLRDRKDMAELHMISGKPPKDLAVFRPSRMALHETVAALVTRTRMVNVAMTIEAFIEGHPLYRDHIEVEAIFHDATFPEMAGRFLAYAAFLIDDHFDVLNPQPGVRNVLLQEKEIIEKRIKDKSYDPRTAESRQALRKLVADKLLGEYYRAKIREMVDGAIDGYLKENPHLDLARKANPDRIAWVTVGGPASGKSSLDDLIASERGGYGETASACRVNPDDYRGVLLRRTGDPDEDSLHANFTHEEASRITDLILERLGEMTEEGHAPDMWLDMVNPSDKRMSLAAHGGAQVRLYVATCAPHVAIERAFLRATKKDGKDRGRFVPTRVVLQGHREVSRSLPLALAQSPHVLRLINTEASRHADRKSSASPPLIASGNGFDKNVEVHDIDAFMGFVRKSALNIDGKTPQDLFPRRPDEEAEVVAATLMKYLEGGCVLNFRYPKASDSGRTSRKEEAVLRHFAHVGSERVHIDDFSGFLRYLNEAQHVGLPQAARQARPSPRVPRPGRRRFAVHFFRGPTDVCRDASARFCRGPHPRPSAPPARTIHRSLRCRAS